MVAARRRSASSGPLRGLQRHVRRRARSCVQSNLPAMPTIGEGGLIPPISGQSPFVVRWTLKSLGYRLQANRKTHEGGKHPDRNAQFLYIKAQKEKFAAAGRPILSIDAKKKEPIGNYKNGGRELCAKSWPEHVNVYDFVDPAIGRATPYGVYDITRNKGWVSVGISFDTARFAVNTLRQWWLNCGEREYAGAQGLLVNADGGGSNGSRG